MIVILAPIIIFGPMLLSGRALFWGTPLLQFVPWREFAFESIRNGHLPLWNPLVGMGAPLIANYQSALFYPPNVLLFLTDPAWGHGLLVLLHIVWAGLGMVYLTRRLGFGLMAQAIAGLAFSLSGYSIARAGFLSINAAVSWLPWMIAWTDAVAREVSQEGIRRKSLRPIIFLTIMLTMQWLSGHAQTAWYSLILIVSWGLWRSYTLERWKGIAYTAIGMLFAGMFAFALSAIQLIPVLEYLNLSQRATDINRDLALTYSFWPWRLLGLLIPNVFGNPAQGDYWGYANFWEDAIYIGVLPFILGILGAIRGIRKKQNSSFIIFLLILIGFSFLMALGNNTAIFTFLFDQVPTFDLFQAPSRWMVIFVFCLSLLAAFGADLWEKEKLVRLFWVRLGTVGAMTIAVVALLSPTFLPDIKVSFIHGIASTGILLGITGIIAWRRRLRPGNAWPIAIFIFVAVDLIWAANGLNPSIPSAFYESPSKLSSTIVSGNRVYMPAEIEYELKFNQTHRFDTFNPEVDWEVVRDRGLPNTAMLDGIPSANNFDPLIPNTYALWMTRLEQDHPDENSSILALMDVGWLAQENVDGFYVEVAGPARIRTVGQVRWVDDESEALDQVFNHEFDPTKQVILHGNPQLPSTSYDPEGTLEIVKQSDPNRVVVRASMSTNSWLVLSDLWFPGWRVYVDGSEQPILKADYLFRAVELRPGEHLVEFVYRPMSFTLGLVISVIAWIGLGAVLWVIKKT
jgi:hypothetical protein